MLLPRSDSREKLRQYEERGELRLQGAMLKRHGKASIVTLSNPRYLNAEDETTLAGTETRSTSRCSTRRAKCACCAAMW